MTRANVQMFFNQPVSIDTFTVKELLDSVDSGKDLWVVDQETQRSIDLARVKEIATLIKNQRSNVYFPGFILSSRKNGSFAILDGQHRYRAIIKAIRDLQVEAHANQENIEQILQQKLPALIYHQLDLVKERQLFFDINGLQRPLHASVGVGLNVESKSNHMYRHLLSVQEIKILLQEVDSEWGKEKSGNSPKQAMGQVLQSVFFPDRKSTYSPATKKEEMFFQEYYAWLCEYRLKKAKSFSSVGFKNYYLTQNWEFAVARFVKGKKWHKGSFDECKSKLEITLDFIAFHERNVDAFSEVGCSFKRITSGGKSVEVIYPATTVHLEKYMKMLLDKVYNETFKN